MKRTPPLEKRTTSSKKRRQYVKARRIAALASNDVWFLNGILTGAADPLVFDFNEVVDHHSPMGSIPAERLERFDPDRATVIRFDSDFGLTFDVSKPLAQQAIDQMEAFVRKLDLAIAEVRARYSEERILAVIEKLKAKIGQIK